jgi:hypothetical protein
MTNKPQSNQKDRHAIISTWITKKQYLKFHKLAADNNTSMSKYLSRMIDEKIKENNEPIQSK